MRSRVGAQIVVVVAAHAAIVAGDIVRPSRRPLLAPRRTAAFGAAKALVFAVPSTASVTLALALLLLLLFCHSQGSPALGGGGCCACSPLD